MVWVTYQLPLSSLLGLDQYCFLLETVKSQVAINKWANYGPQLCFIMTVNPKAKISKMSVSSIQDIVIGKLQELLLSNPEQLL